MGNSSGEVGEGAQGCGEEGEGVGHGGRGRFIRSDEEVGRGQTDRQRDGGEGRLIKNQPGGEQVNNMAAGFEWQERAECQRRRNDNT